MINLQLLNKEERASQAQLFTDIITHEFPEDIEMGINNTSIYTDPSWVDLNQYKYNDRTDVILQPTDTICSALNVCRNRVNEEDEKVMVLNFASYKYPGGQFLGGSSAQEEFICHHSVLFPILSHFEPLYYRVNRQNLNKALYNNRALYTKHCLLLNTVMDKKGHVDFMKERHYVDVLTCAAPNVGAFYRYRKDDSMDENQVNKIIDERIKFIFEIAKANRVDTLILGAFGCGVFKNNPKVIARSFIKTLKNYFPNDFQKVIFAIPKGPNYTAFAKVLLNEKWGIVK